MVRPALRLPLLLVAGLLAACASDPAAEAPCGPPPTCPRPRPRTSGPRLPPPSTADPAAPATVRTDHVAIRSDAGDEATAAVARLAAAHVRELLARFGEVLDLRLPAEPLPVVVHAERASFGAALERAAPDHSGWGAFYEAGSGTVHVCLAPAAQGALPWQADLRHEMTHQVLDLSSPAVERGRIFRGHYLWLWEGFAAWTETLGEPPPGGVVPARQARFDRRRARGEVTPLPVLFHLDQASFEGRHYDQCAVLMQFLMADGVSGSRRAVLETLAALLRGRAAPGDLQRRLGLDARALEERWGGRGP